MKKVLVAGGGPCGITASYFIKKYHPDYEVVLLEKDNDIGKRILVSGNGRCNFSNDFISPDAYHNGELIKNIISEYKSEEEHFLKEINLHYYSDEEGRRYPLSNSSKTVKTLLESALKKAGVFIHTEEKIISVREKKVITDKKEYEYDYLILAIGGISYLYDKNSHGILSELKIKETSLRPSLCPLTVKEKIPKAIVGKRSKAEVSLIKDNKEIYKEKGEVIFKKDGISGICIFNMTSLITGDISKYSIRLNIAGKVSEDDIVSEEKTFGRKNTLSAYANEEIAEYLDKLNESTYSLLTSLTYHPVSLYDFKDSQVTRGGISLDEVNPDNLSLKKYPNIFAGGELLDVDAKCGGYNIFFAMASGYYIAKNM